MVFVVVPHVVRSQELDQANLRAIDTGEGQSIDLRHAENAAPAPTVRPAALERPAGTFGASAPPKRHARPDANARECPDA